MAVRRKSAGRSGGSDEVATNRTCGECAHLTVMTEFHTLTVHGRKPTLGRCPYDTRCRLLSERGCGKWKAPLQPSPKGAGDGI